MVLHGKQGLLKYWLQGISVYNLFGSLPYEWSKSKEKFQSKSPRQVDIYAGRVLISVLYFLLILLQVLYTWDISPPPVKMHTVSFLAIWLFCLNLHYFNWKEREGNVSLYNDLLTYDKKSKLDTMNQNLEQFHDITKFLLQAQTTFGFFCPIMYHLSIVSNPCFPINLGYWLSATCANTELGVTTSSSMDTQELLTRIGLALTSYLTYGFLTIGACYHEVSVLIMHGHCFRSYVAENGGKMKGIRKMDEGTYHTIIEFRQLQLMLTSYRDFYSRGMIPTMMVGITADEIFCVHNMITAAKNGMSIFSGVNGVYTWIAGVGVYNLLVFFGTLADVYKNSSRREADIKSNVVLGRSKWYRKWHKSCPLLRVYFGGTNYFEPLTPLNMMDFVINQTVSLLLLK